MSNTKTSRLAELAELETKVSEAQKRVARLRIERDAATTAAHEADAALVRAYADDSTDPKELKRLTDAKQRTTDAVAQPWEAMLTGARSAVTQAEAELAAFVTEHLEVLLGERSPQAWAKARAVEQALAGVAEAVSAWRTEEQAITRLLRLAGVCYRRTRPLSVPQLARDVSRFTGRVPPPLPVDSDSDRPADTALVGHVVLNALGSGALSLTRRAWTQAGSRGSQPAPGSTDRVACGSGLGVFRCFGGR